MKQYYIHIGAEQKGPLSFEDLKNQLITSDTMVWYEGMVDWQKANSLEELKPLFKTTPPPLYKPTPIPPPVYTEEYSPPTYNPDTNEPVKILGIRKNIFIYGVLGLAFIICISAFSSIQSTTQENTQTKEQLEVYNQKLEEQQKAIDEQNARIAEQERLEKKRVEKERRLAIAKRIDEISNQLAVAYENLDKAKFQLHDASAFKLLRSSERRHEQVGAAETVVKSWENEIAQLEKDMRRINPTWAGN